MYVTVSLFHLSPTFKGKAGLGIDTQHNDTQHNDTKHNDTKHDGSQLNDIQYNENFKMRRTA